MEAASVPESWARRLARCHSHLGVVRAPQGPPGVGGHRPHLSFHSPCVTHQNAGSVSTEPLSVFLTAMSPEPKTVPGTEAGSEQLMVDRWLSG